MELCRVGSQGDGGYLIPKFYQEFSRKCLSVGVGDNVEFEESLSMVNFKVYLLDGTIDKIPGSSTDRKNFTSKNIGSYTANNKITFSDWIKKIDEKIDMDTILKMDIEGDEYQTLHNISDDDLKKISILVVEFHGLDAIFNISKFASIFDVFDKICNAFDIVHIHPNNASQIYKKYGVAMPEMLEITFINKNLNHPKTEKIEIPHRFDQKNIEHKKNLLLPEVFWK